MQSEFVRVGVLGCGLMGSGIAEVCVRQGMQVVVVEADATAAEHGLTRVTASMQRGVSSGKIDAAANGAALARLEVTDDWSAFGSCDLVIEAISEDPDLKVSAFQRLDEVVESPDAILASNTSSIPIMRLAT